MPPCPARLYFQGTKLRKRTVLFISLSSVAGAFGPLASTSLTLTGLNRILVPASVTALIVRDALVKNEHGKALELVSLGDDVTAGLGVNSAALPMKRGSCPMITARF